MNNFFTTPIFHIGQGYDLHTLIENRPLILGGVHIPFDKGLHGHSDADVLLHAIIDAMLGASGLGDIGQYFSDQKKEYNNISSRVLLCKTLLLIQNAGYKIGNIDSTIICQNPKLSPYIPIMIDKITEDLKISNKKCVNIKAKTNENLGYLGRGEGIAAYTNVLLYKV